VSPQSQGLQLRAELGPRPLPRAQLAAPCVSRPELRAILQALRLGDTVPRPSAASDAHEKPTVVVARFERPTVRSSGCQMRRWRSGGSAEGGYILSMLADLSIWHILI